MIKKVVLHKGREEPIRRRHPWIFSGAVKALEGDPQDGDRVQVVDHTGHSLGWGHFHNGSIQVKLLQFGEETPHDKVIAKALEEALELRHRLGLGKGQPTTGYRLVHGEGDNLPGLIVDIYGSVAVVQAHSIGMHRELPLVCEMLKKLLGPDLDAIYDKSTKTLPPDYARQIQDGYLWGAGTSITFLENNISFNAHWEDGQKTGFFLDQRENRALLAKYAAGQRILNTFCYTGGFSMYALQAGAEWVDSIDVSNRALGQLEAILALNHFAPEKHHSQAVDVMPFFTHSVDKWDIVILDPPAFAKSINKRHQAVQGYKRLNAMGMRCVKPGGLLFTFSCSQVVDAQLFRDTVVAAALESGLRARIIHFLSQGPDHPVNLALPETSYLKGLVLQILE